MNCFKPISAFLFICACIFLSACSFDANNFTFDESEMEGIKAIQKNVPNAKVNIKKGVSVKTGAEKKTSYEIALSYTSEPTAQQAEDFTSMAAWAFYDQLNDSLRTSYQFINAKASGGSSSYTHEYAMSELASVSKCMPSARLFIQGFIDADQRLIAMSCNGDQEKINSMADELIIVRAKLETEWGNIERQKFIGFSSDSDTTIKVSFYLNWSKTLDSHRIDLQMRKDNGRISGVDL